MRIGIVVAALILVSTGPLRAQGEAPRMPTFDPSNRGTVPAPEEGEVDPDPFPTDVDPAAASRESIARHSDMVIEAERAERVLDRHTPRSRWEQVGIVLAIAGAGILALFAWFVLTLRSRQR